MTDKIIAFPTKRAKCEEPIVGFEPEIKAEQILENAEARTWKHLVIAGIDPEGDFYMHITSSVDAGKLLWIAKMLEMEAMGINELQDIVLDNLSDDN